MGCFPESNAPDTAPLSAGDYYVQVAEYGNDETIDSYYLSFTATPCPTVSGYMYTTFQGDTIELYPYEGRNIALLVPSPTLNDEVLERIINVFDDAYDYYAQVTGREPTLSREYNGLGTIAVVSSTCGAGCAYLGATGIEILDPYFDILYEGVHNNDEFDQVLFYELGRNFWFYGDSLEYKEPDMSGSVTSGYAVFMRFMAMESTGVNPAPFRETDFATFKTEVKGLVGLYLNDPTLNWSNTLRIGQAPANSMNLSGADLFASFMFALRDRYGDTFVDEFWKEAANRPTAKSTQDAVDNFIIASSLAADSDLSALFTDEWRWPISESAREELDSLFGPQDEYALDAFVFGNGRIEINPEKALYTDGESVTLTAIPDSGWGFDWWTGDASGTNNPITIVMDSDKNITANFIAISLSPYEPDDSSSEASWIQTGETQEHSIDPIGDEDWIKFSLNGSSAATIETSGVGADTYMWLYDGNLNLIEEDDDGNGLYAKIDRTCGNDPLSAGNYYVKVAEYSGSSTIDSYMITYSATSCSTPNPSPGHNLYLPLVRRR